MDKQARISLNKISDITIQMSNICWRKIACTKGYGLCELFLSGNIDYGKDCTQFLDELLVSKRVTLPDGIENDIAIFRKYITDKSGILLEEEK